MSFGQRLAGAMDQFRSQKAAEDERKLKAQVMQAQLADVQEQARIRQAQADALKRKDLQDQMWRADLAKQLTPVQGIDANATSGITGPRPEALSVVGQQRPIDWQRLMLAGMPAELAKSMAEASNLGRPKAAREVTIAGPDGSPQVVLVDDYNNPVGQPYKKPVEVSFEDLGGKKVAVNKYATPVGASLTKTQDPNSLASNALGWARLNFDKTKDARDGAAGQLVETPTGYVRVGKDNTSIPVMAPGGASQLQGKGSNMTEDQGKATGWLVQAETAYKNMLSAGFDKDGKPKSAAYPGPVDAISMIPGIGGPANYLRSADRQKFMQASSSLSEALLRAATGAGVNKDEAAQKVRELTPVFGEDESTTAQKMASIPLYIESLKVRAGPGASKAGDILRTNQEAPTFIDIVNAELARRGGK